MFVLLFLLSLMATTHAAQSAQTKEYVLEGSFELIENSLLYITTTLTHQPTQSKALESHSFSIVSNDGEEMIWKSNGPGQHFSQICPPLTHKKFSKGFEAAKKILEKNHSLQPNRVKKSAIVTIEMTQSELESVQE